MEKTYTLTESQLEEIIAQRMSYKPITPQGLFKEASFKGDELLEINQRYPLVVERLETDWNVKSINPVRFIYMNTPHINEVTKEKSYHRLGFETIHTSVKNLVLNVFGKSKNRDLTEDEYELAQELYSELKEWYINSYSRRLEQTEEV